MSEVLEPIKLVVNKDYKPPLFMVIAKGDRVCCFKKFTLVASKVFGLEFSKSVLNYEEVVKTGASVVAEDLLQEVAETRTHQANEIFKLRCWCGDAKTLFSYEKQDVL